jgi:hypothetical protein
VFLNLKKGGKCEREVAGGIFLNYYVKSNPVTFPLDDGEERGGERERMSLIFFYKSSQDLRRKA